jgi:hypothetical protein
MMSVVCACMLMFVWCATHPNIASPPTKEYALSALTISVISRQKQTHSPTIPITKKSTISSSNLPSSHMKIKPSTPHQARAWINSHSHSLFFIVSSTYSKVMLQTRTTVAGIHTPKYTITRSALAHTTYLPPSQCTTNDAEFSGSKSLLICIVVLRRVLLQWWLLAGWLLGWLLLQHRSFSTSFVF